MAGGSIAEMALEGLTMHAIPWLAKKGVEMGSYGASELMRKKKYAEKSNRLCFIKSNSFYSKTGSDMLNQLSTKVRPNIKYKTDRKYIDGGAIDIHKAILKIAPKKGFVLPGHHYTGPGNPINQQLKYDPNTGQILEIYDKPTGKTDAIAMQHDVDYSVCKDDKKCKNKADRKMVKALDNVPYNQRQWGHWLARNTIDIKQKVGLGNKRKSKNGKRR